MYAVGMSEGCPLPIAGNSNAESSVQGRERSAGMLGSESCSAQTGADRRIYTHRQACQVGQVGPHHQASQKGLLVRLAADTGKNERPPKVFRSAFAVAPEAEENEDASRVRDLRTKNGMFLARRNSSSLGSLR